MKFSVSRAAILSALTHANAIVERRSVQPILTNVLVRANHGEVSVIATDMDMEYKETFAADVGQPGDATVPAHTLYDILRKLPDDSDVVVTYDRTSFQMQISSGRSRFKLAGLDPDDFPQISATPGEWFDMSAKDLATQIDATKFAISTEETRYFLNGIYMHRSGDAFRAVATDGHRLSRHDVPHPEGATGIEYGVIVPRKAVGVIRRLLEEAGGAVSLLVTPSRIGVKIDQITVFSKLIDGAFPDYARVIPQENKSTVTADAKVMAATVDRIATVTTEKTRAIRLDIGKGKISVSATGEMGSATEEIDAEYSAAQPISIGFNARYLMDALGQFSDKVMISLGDAASPAIMTREGDPSALIVLMPMRV